MIQNEEKQANLFSRNSVCNLLMYIVFYAGKAMSGWIQICQRNPDPARKVSGSSTLLETPKAATKESCGKATCYQAV